MGRLDIQVPTTDGSAKATLHVPDGDGPWPGVLVFVDAAGTRETFSEMGDQLAEMGYVALIPDVYYRAGEWAPFDIATVFGDEQERTRLFGIMGSLTNDRIVADAGSYADFLLARPEVAGSAIGTTGYCMGGRMSLVAAAAWAPRSLRPRRSTAAGWRSPTTRRARTLRPARSPRRSTSPEPKTTAPLPRSRPSCWTPRSAARASTTPSSSTRRVMGSPCPTTPRTTPTPVPGTGRRLSSYTSPASSRRIPGSDRSMVLLTAIPTTVRRTMLLSDLAGEQQ